MISGRGVQETATTKRDLVPGCAFDIVAIAASAGGLSALTSVLSRLPTDFAPAVVVVQHLDPRHRSLLAEILGRCASLPVSEAVQGERVRPGHVHVAPPDRHLSSTATGRWACTSS